jgi:hypothetical protein
MSPSIDSIADAVLGVIDRFIAAVNALAPLSLEMIDCSSKFTQLYVLPMDHPELKAYKNALHQGINDCACASQTLISRLNSFELLIKLNPTQFVSGILKMDSGADRQAILLKAVETMIADKARLISSLPTEVNVLVLCIECSSLRDGIITRTDLAISSLLAQIAALAAEKCNSISASYKGVLAKINERPNDPEKLFELEAFNSPRVAFKQIQPGSGSGTLNGSPSNSVGAGVDRFLRFSALIQVRPNLEFKGRHFFSLQDERHCTWHCAGPLVFEHHSQAGAPRVAICHSSPSYFGI